jgi:hypothetical protein
MEQNTNALSVELVSATPPLTPAVWKMIEAIAVAAHESRKVGVTSRGEAAIKFLFCYENGLPLSAANTGLYIVNGRIAAQSNIIAAQIRKHPDYDYRVKQIDNQGCTIEILRRVGGEWRVEGEASFTEDDAKRAGLSSKDNYQGYPSDMYFNRALARAQKRFAPDVFSQPVYTPEEMGMPTDDEGNVIEGQWKVAPPVPASNNPNDTPQHTGHQTVPSLTWLVDRYGPEAVMAANGDAIPGTDEEVAAVAAKLEEAGNG